MRINITGDPDVAPDNVIIHGKIPTRPEKSCRNCTKVHDCLILQYSMNAIQGIDFVPRVANSLMQAYDLPLPMPCRGEAWQAVANRTFDHDPLIQRLGLSDVQEPNSNSKDI